MYQSYPYPPGAARLKGDWRGRPLPPLPNTPFLTAILQYRPDQTFELFSRDCTHPEKVIKITVIEPTDVGYGKLSQSFKARVINGPPHLVDKTVFAKFYDPLYINPDDVLTIYPETDLNMPPGSSSSADSTEAETFAGSVELSRKKSAASTGGDTLASSVELEKGSDGVWKLEEEIGEGVDRDVSEEKTPDKEHGLWSRKDILKMMGDDHNPKNKDWDDTIFPVETRKCYSDRLFTIEERAYSALRTVQGRFVAKCFGSFHVRFPDRELPDDQIVNGLLLEWIGGEPLTLVDSSELNFRKRKEIRESVLEIIRSVYAKGVYLTDVDFGNFVLVANGHTPRMHGFSFTFSPDELEQEQLDRLPIVNVKSMEYLLDDAGLK